MPKSGSVYYMCVAHLNVADFGPIQVRCGLMLV